MKIVPIFIFVTILVIIGSLVVIILPALDTTVTARATAVSNTTDIVGSVMHETGGFINYLLPVLVIMLGAFAILFLISKL